MPTTISPPILIWTPGGGVPVGPVSNPPVYSQKGITPLIQGQAYIDVVFGSVQTSLDWVLATCEVENTTDVAPLNIWPGIITNRTAAGFRLQLNGMPDSGNYYLHWAVSGVNITPVTASTYTLTGPSSGGLGVAATFTVALPPSTTLAAPVVVTPSDGGFGTPGTFSPTFVTLTTGSPSATFTYTPASYGVKTISTTNSGPLSNPASIVFSVMTTTYTLSGPSSGTVGVASTNFTVALPVGGAVSGTVTVTMHDAGGGGTFTPTTVGLTTGAPSATFTYTPASAGAKTISVTNDGGLTNPGNLTYTASAPGPGSIAGLKLWLAADSLALADGAAVATWPDTSGLGNTPTQATPGSRPTFKTAIVNSLPVVRFNAAASNYLLFSPVITNTLPWTVFAVMRAPVGQMAATLSSGTDQTYGCGINASGILSLGDGVDVFFGTSVISSATVFHVCTSVAPSPHTISSGKVYVDGVAETMAIATAAGAYGGFDAIGLIGGVGFGNADIAELLMYNSALGTTDRQTVELYLKAKYNTP